MWRTYLGEISTLISETKIIGSTDSRFRSVRDAFAQNFSSHGEKGASLCVIVDGQIVVDLAGGIANESGDAWLPSTLVNSFSVGKGILSIVLASLVTSGQVDIDEPIRIIWPQLRAAQETPITTRDIAGHRAGLPAISEPLANVDLFQWARVIEAIEKQEPWWTPGTSHGYHVNTFGFLIGEIISRSTQLSFRQLLDPVHELINGEMFFGVPVSEHSRIADLSWAPTPVSLPAEEELRQMSRDQQMKILAYSNPQNFSGITAVNSLQWREAVHPSTNLHSTARGIAKIYHALLSHPQIFSPSVIADFTTTVSDGDDYVLGSHTHFGVGFQLPTTTRSFGPNQNSFGHYGAGGSMGFVDLTSHLSVGYVMNHMGQGWQNERNQSLLNAVYSCL